MLAGSNVECLDNDRQDPEAPAEVDVVDVAGAWLTRALSHRQTRPGPSRKSR